MDTQPHPPPEISPPANGHDAPGSARASVAWERPRRPDPAGRILPALILIALGLVFLVGNVISIGGLLFLGLGAAFLLARVLTGNYGLAVPAGVLLGFGSFVALDESGLLPGDNGGWFFILLGLGFLAVYVIGLRPGVIWPFFPAAALIAFGLVMQGLLDLGPLAQLGWLGAYWPVALIAVGVWLLVRDRLPAETRQPVAIAGAILLLLYAVIAGAGAIATTGVTLTGEGIRVNGGLFRSVTPLTETEELTAPIAAGQTFRVDNPAGQTVIRAGSGGEVRVTVTRHRWSADQRLDVRLAPGGDGLSLTSATDRVFGRAPYADFVVEVPAGVPVVARSASGSIQISGLSGAVDAESASGSVRVSDTGGPVTARSASGSVRLSDISGELRASSSSGSVEASDVARVREVSTASGSIRLDGAFTQDARVQSSSGSVRITFAPESSTRITATTTSGSISTGDLALQNVQQDRRYLTGTLGSGAGHLTIETTSGSIRLAD